MKKDMQTFYKFKHKDINIEKHSSSGGAFTMLSDEILDFFHKADHVLANMGVFSMRNLMRYI